MKNNTDPTQTRTSALPSRQWVRETPVAILEENELPAWRDAQQVLEVVREMGATFLRYPAIGWGAHFYGHSDFLPKYPLIAPHRDLYGEIHQKMKEQNIRMMAYCHYGVLYRQLEETHPHWLARDADGAPLAWSGNPYHRLACLCHDGFREAMRNAIREMAERYQPDAVYLDGPAWYGSCFCEDCRKRYYREYGENLPAALSREDGSLQRMNRLRDLVTTEVIRDVRAALREVHDCPLLFNTSPHHKASAETGMSFADGANTTEVHRPGSFWEILECVKLGEGLRKASLCYLPPGPYDTLRTYDNDEVSVFGAAYAMHGATAMLQSPLGFMRDRTGIRRINEFTRNVACHAQVYYRAEPVRELGLVYSRTAWNHERTGCRGFAEKMFSGAFQALLHGHRHFDCLFDTQLATRDLAEYRALYIPGAGAMSAEQAAALRAFVKNGGTLIAGNDCGLLDDEGDARANFPLADVLGVDYCSGRPDMPYTTREYRETGPRHGYSLVPEAYLRLKPGRLCADRLQPGMLVPVSDAVVGVPELERWIDYTLVRTGEQTEVLAELFLPAGGAGGAPLEFPFAKPPGITIHQYGNGRAVYLAAPLEMIYLRRRLPDARNLLIAVIDLALEGRPAITLKGPCGVIVNLTRDATRHYIHLLNYCGSMFEHGNPVEEIVPVHDLTIRCRWQGESVKAVTLSGQRELDARVEHGYAVIRLPVLDIHETICLE